MIIWDCASQHTSSDITNHDCKQTYNSSKTIVYPYPTFLLWKRIHMFIIVEFVPPGCTGLIQVADVGLIKPMKDYVKDYFLNQMNIILAKKKNMPVNTAEVNNAGRKSTKVGTGYSKAPNKFQNNGLLKDGLQ